MAGIFRISNANSFRWVEKNPSRDIRYRTVPFDDMVDENNPAGPYAAPWEKNDKAQVQALSDFPLTLKFYDCVTGIEYLEIPIPEIVTFIIGETFKCYQAEIDFSVFDVGVYFAEITFNDGVSDRIFQTSPLDVDEIQLNTILYEGKNTINAKGIIFDATDLVINFRFHGSIWNPLFKADNQLYTDQKHNVTQEDSVAYRNHTLTIGGNPVARGIPPWVIDKLNILFTLDQKKLDGTYYEKSAPDNNFEPVRPENTNNPDGFWSISIIPNENFFLDSYKTGDEPIDTDLIVIALSKGFIDVAANLAVVGLFKTNSTLVGLQITNKTGVEFEMKVGTTNGGAEITTLNVPTDLLSYHLINHPFNGVQTAYLTGITEQGALDLNVWIRYDQLDAQPIVPSGGTGSGFPKGYMGMYREVDEGDFEIHWNADTGLGNVGTAYYGCAIYGTNGIGDGDGEKNLIPAIWDYLQPGERDTKGGAINNLITLIKNNIPVLNIKFGTDKKGGGGGVPVLSSDFNGLNPPGSKTPDINVGGVGSTVNITPRILKTLHFVKLTD